MATIIELFSKRVLAVNPHEYELKDTKRHYSEMQERIIARFGDNVPAHFKTAMSKPQKQPYMYGDVHNVKYRVKSRNFNKPYPVPCEVTASSCVKNNSYLVLGSKCIDGIDEPLPWMDHKYQVTLSFLKSLNNGTWLKIFTRSDLVAHDDYVQELRRLKVEVTILYASEDDDFNRTIEPGAPSYKLRMQAFNKLDDCGISVTMLKHELPVTFKEIG